MRRTRPVRSGSVGALVLLLLCAGLVPTADARGPRRTEDRPACHDHDPLRTAFFGDLHVHTSFSQDASTQGTRNDPHDAYRFARGEPLGIQPYAADGQPLRRLQLARPLDFAAVTDHAELLGEVEICRTPGLPGHDAWICRIQRRWPRLAFFFMNYRSTYPERPERYGFCGPGGRHCLEAARTPWREIQRAAEVAYDRSAECRFTSFVGYEWTGAPRSRNLHRNVLFRNATVPDLPYSNFEAPSPQRLWRALRDGCIEGLRGCDVLVIPHNPNLSGGTLFDARGARGGVLQRNDALTQSLFEPLVEVMQHKGDSECIPGVGGADELCGFEKLPYDDFRGKYVRWLAQEPGAASFVREGLERGLLHEERIGRNPFRYGLVASTDTHLGTPGAADEDGFPGHGGAGMPARDALPRGLPDELEFNPGGLAVLWAEENSRDALFEAMRRREAYGTSGTRPIVRFFGGWDLPADLCERADFARVGYERGVPMGGVLQGRASPDVTLAFAVWALRDAGTPGRSGTPLQRIQIVKGWVQDGEARERVLDVAGDAQNGASVDLRSCEPQGAGADELCTVWEDPDFDPTQRAFYYARVLENPTCRWSQRVCNARGVVCERPETVPRDLEACCAPQHRRSIQERAWTSPIWYRPEPPRRGGP